MVAQIGPIWVSKRGRRRHLNMSDHVSLQIALRISERPWAGSSGLSRQWRRGRLRQKPCSYPNAAEKVFFRMSWKLCHASLARSVKQCALRVCSLYPCAREMLIFSVSFQFDRMISVGVPSSLAISVWIAHGLTLVGQSCKSNRRSRSLAWIRHSSPSTARLGRNATEFNLSSTNTVPGRQDHKCGRNRRDSTSCTSPAARASA